MTATRSTEKQDVIQAKLMAQGILPEDALQIAQDVLAIAYQKTKSTKRRSYESYMTKYGKTKKDEVYDFLRKTDIPLSRQEVANFMGEKVSTICARVNELMHEGFVVQCGTKKDEETNKTVNLLRAVNVGEY